MEFPNVPAFGSVNLSAVGGGSGMADLFVEPFVLGWHAKRADVQLAEAIRTYGTLQSGSLRQRRLGLLRKPRADGHDVLRH